MLENKCAGYHEVVGCMWYEQNCPADCTKCFGYKTREEISRSNAKRLERLRSLDPQYQEYIKSKYHIKF